MNEQRAVYLSYFFMVETIIIYLYPALIISRSDEIAEIGSWDVSYRFTLVSRAMRRGGVFTVSKKDHTTSHHHKHKIDLLLVILVSISISSFSSIIFLSVDSFALHHFARYWVCLYGYYTVTLHQRS
jgi:hypothetical protein